VRRALVLVLLLVGIVRAGDPEKIDASHVKVGQRYTFKLTAGNSAVWEVTSVTGSEVLYRIRCTVAGKPVKGADEENHFALERKARPDDRVAKKADEKELVVSGVRFPCAILETETGGTLVRTWRAASFPEIVKVQMGKDVTSELVSIEGP
jgi:hypothetical protein